MRTVAARGSRSAIVLLACSTACVIALHVLRTDLDPAAHRLSEYANGPYGHLMTVAFVALGGALLALAAGLRSRDQRQGLPQVTYALLAVSGTGMIVSGIFRTDPAEPPSAAEILHSRASGTAFLALIVATVAWSWAARTARPRAMALASVVTGGASVALHDTRWTGAGQRVLCLVLLAWLWLAARECQVERSEDAGDRVAG